MLGHEAFSRYYQLFYIDIHKYWITSLFLLKCARQKQWTDWCGYYVCEFMHLLTPCGMSTMEDLRVHTNRSQVHFPNYTNAMKLIYQSFFPKWKMCRIGDECYSTDRINAVCEQLAGFIWNEILDPRGEFYHDGHIHRGFTSTSWGAQLLNYKYDLYIC